MNVDIGIILAFGVYLVFMLIIGGVFYGKTQNNEDYFLGGRKLGAW